MSVIANVTSDGSTVFFPNYPLTVPATTPGNLLIGICQYALTARTVSSISGGATWDVAASRLHDVSGLGGRLQAFAAICTGVTTTFDITLNSDDIGPDRITLIEVTVPADPMAEVGTSTENNVFSSTSFNCTAVTPVAGPVIFVSVISFSADTGAWTEDPDFVNHVVPGAPSFSAIASRIQADAAAQSYEGASASATSATQFLVCVQLSAGTPPASPGLPFVTMVSAKRV